VAAEEDEEEGSGLARRPEGQMLPAGSALVSGEVAELEHALAPDVKMRGPEPVRRWPGRAAPRGGASEGSGISPEWLRREARPEAGASGARETEPEEPEEELGVGWWCLEEECGSGETGESLPGGSVSGLSVEERSTAAAKASERVSGIGAGGRWDIPPSTCVGRRRRWISLRGGRWLGAEWAGERASAAWEVVAVRGGDARMGIS
jgi:hypothetical protein